VIEVFYWEIYYYYLVESVAVVEIDFGEKISIL